MRENKQQPCFQCLAEAGSWKACRGMIVFWCGTCVRFANRKRAEVAQ